MKTIEFDKECPSCGATGVYKGFGEINSGVVCRNCDGTGCVSVSLEYEPFKQRKTRSDIKWIYEANHGIFMGEDNKHSFQDFGGMAYAEWEEVGKFPQKSEPREHSCPAWWYQTVGYDKKPDWEECGNHFATCSSYPSKAKCWKRWDKEFG